MSDEIRTFRKPLEGHTRVKLVVSYDGTDFLGWQRQGTKPTVQFAIESSLSHIFKQPITIQGSGRTDTGVHAVAQVVHFDAPKDPTKFNLRYAIQSQLPDSIAVKEVWIAPRDFHAVASCTHKSYKYFVLNRGHHSSLRHRYTHWIRFPLNLDYLNQVSSQLVGKHDFKSFQSSGTEVRSTIREIFEAKWEQPRPDTFVFTITGDGFLKQMVRNIVGTCVDMNQKAVPADQMTKVLNALDRRVAGPTAPPQGLFLYRVYYPQELDNQCRKL